MRPGSLLYTSESVSEGHPGKIADQLVVVAGEFRTCDEAIFCDMEAGAESLAR